MYYFAYGSNLHRNRLSARVGPVVDRGRALLAKHQMAFRKNGQDGSAKCDLVEVDDVNANAEGVVYQMEATAKPILDAIEGVGRGYRVATVSVTLDDGRGVNPIDCFVYIAEPPYVAADVLPYDWYRDFVYEGGKTHGFSDGWLRFVSNHPVLVDPDRKRRQDNRAILVTPTPSA